MEELLHEIVCRCRASERVALCVVVGTRGSTPQSAGAKMVIAADGKSVGTLGGGCVEAEVRKRAIEMIQTGASAMIEFKLDHDFGWDDGMICGGVMEIHIQTIDSTGIEKYQRMVDAMHVRQTVPLEIAYERAGERMSYIEEVGPGPMLVIAGAGHVGQALGELASKLDFRFVVIDDRADFANESRFPSADARIVGDIETELRKFTTDPNAYIVIVTRGHQRDGAALAAVIDSPAKYVGMIGSKRKIKTIFDDLAQSGVSLEKLKRVHAPIGYRIGAVTVNEIAVSIAAELIAVRHGLGDKPATAMKIDSLQVDKWAQRRTHG